jgi:chromate transporter
LEKTFYNIFKTFFKTGTMLLGGGYVILPILQNELVEKKNWLSDSELHEFYALGQSVPGIIAANVSVFTGYKLLGLSGAFAAIAGITMPAFLAIIVIARLVGEVSYLKFIQSIFWGVGVGVLMLIIMAVRELWARSVVDRFSYVIFFLSFVLSACFQAPPTVVIILAIFIGIWIQYQKRLENRE